MVCDKEHMFSKKAPVAVLLYEPPHLAVKPAFPDPTAQKAAPVSEMIQASFFSLWKSKHGEHLIIILRAAVRRNLRVPC